MHFQELFELGMKRQLPQLLEPLEEGMALHIAPGFSYIKDTITTPVNWRFPRDGFPANSNTCSIIHCYHFLEHLPGHDVIEFLKCAELALKVGGIFQFCVPYYSSNMAHHDLTHKSWWTEDTFKTLFGNPYYNDNKEPWKLSVHFQMIAGIAERNLCLIGQLVKGS